MWGNRSPRKFKCVLDPEVYRLPTIVMLIPMEPINALIRESHGLLHVPFESRLGELSRSRHLDNGYLDSERPFQDRESLPDSPPELTPVHQFCKVRSVPCLHKMGASSTPQHALESMGISIKIPIQ
ncbi:hypothetical protein PAAG_04780 [Paracoccidioides lutzii Pb01]|uniref:Uncharacterized protein n=1 Tax=Paracoccidioides lutzii (strain ATCC MYA-826 / Pb01) TaxID=502779 RepID=C1H2F1_PARBA|nr:hypothetical protein PAAG_04780 [Paracoccidioides lutzii Pb01]EEH33731.2 hypothetical protein PAAG_04780 [Paracoccidioides lutzii Pb01]